MVPDSYWRLAVRSSWERNPKGAGVALGVVLPTGPLKLSRFQGDLMEPVEPETTEVIEEKPELLRSRKNLRVFGTFL